MSAFHLADLRQEVRELGAWRTTFRVGWELGRRVRLFELADGLAALPLTIPGHEIDLSALTGLPFARPAAASRARDLAEEGRASLLAQASAALEGRILGFGLRELDYGAPPDPHRDPESGRRWPADLHWSRALGARAGDIKLVWEFGRFPHAYRIARACLFASPTERERLTRGLIAQVRAFWALNPPFRGVHWASGQEVVFRLLAWVFALAALPELRSDNAFVRELGGQLVLGAHHVERYLPYAQHAVYNNHLLSEALGLLLVGTLVPSCQEATRWRARGQAILTEQAERQFYPDGSYIQQSHNYHRVALQDLLWGCVLVEARDEAIPPGWRAALGRSVDFLVAQQNDADGRLPNYGFNDGALPSILSTCAFADFRPTLQAAQLRARGERLYPSGPWDEEALWFAGPRALDEAPLHPPSRRSVSFSHSGYHVLRPQPSEEGTFALFRCGSVLDRFSQVDMLHLDLWWRGHNVLVDAGTYLYNGPPVWHRHFMGTTAHNTIMIDGRNQMLHHRQFKTLYWTPASLLDFGFDAGEGRAWAAGEHRGYARHPGACIHQRSVHAGGPDLWVVVDTMSGSGEHDVRLHWLGGPFPHRHEGRGGRLDLHASAGLFTIQLFDQTGQPLPTSCVMGQEDPPRGWLSRGYATKVPTPSLVAQWRGSLPHSWVSVLSGGLLPRVEVDGRRWTIKSARDHVVLELPS